MFDLQGSHHERVGPTPCDDPLLLYTSSSTTALVARIQCNPDRLQPIGALLLPGQPARQPARQPCSQPLAPAIAISPSVARDAIWCSKAVYLNIAICEACKFPKRKIDVWRGVCRAGAILAILILDFLIYCVSGRLLKYCM